MTRAPPGEILAATVIACALIAEHDQQAAESSELLNGLVPACCARGGRRVQGTVSGRAL